MNQSIIGYATPESTSPKPLHGSFYNKRSQLYPNGPFVSKIGFGGYRIGYNPNHTAYPDCKNALETALKQGCNLVDTSSSYMDGQSEELIGETLLHLEASLPGFRESCVIITKGGYIQGRLLEWVTNAALDGQEFEEICKINPNLWYCVHPGFLEAQIKRSLKNLNLKTLDVFLIHNPEYLLHHALLLDYPLEVCRDFFYKKMHQIFVHLERLCEQGLIKSYGVSSNTFSEPADGKTHVNLAKLLGLAQAISPDHNFKVIQSPLNWIEPGFAFMPATESSDDTLIEFAQRNRLGVLVNRPFNGFHSDGLIRMTQVPHRLEQATQGVDSPKKSPQELDNWRSLAKNLEELALQHLEDQFGFEGAPLSQLVLAQLSSMDGVTSVLCGMRRPTYVEDVSNALKLPKMINSKKVLSQIFSDLEFHKQQPPLA